MNRFKFEIKQEYEWGHIGGYSVTVGDRTVARARYNGCEITQMEVDTMFRYAGIGTALLKQCEESLRKNGCRQALVYSGPTSPNQPNPRVFYHKNGYHGWNHLHKDLN